ncbi:MAG: DNA-protecting protein DprA [Flavobacteriales bacterium]|nr:DNA-protecting protein DprA [Flavobacteriales bacterium]
MVFLEGAGSVLSKKLIAYCGSSEAVFKQSKNALEKIPGIGSEKARKITEGTDLGRAEEELVLMEKNGIDMHFYLDPSYPRRLKHCDDGPLILFSKGNVQFNNEKCLSLVGTRNATSYGTDLCRKVIEEMKEQDPLIISGLAYGIDVAAHKAAVKNGVGTVAVLAHGLDKLYPALHKGVALDMVENGGLVSEFPVGTPAMRDNFPSRNRIIAGMSDAIIIVESAWKGGSMITAEFGNSYNRDVFALPGRITDGYSEGCNRLIKSHKAHIFTGVADLEYIMGWVKEEKKVIQRKVFIDLSPEEEKLLGLLRLNSDTIDNISLKSEMPISTTSSILLNLEFNGLVRSLPGKVYELV